MPMVATVGSEELQRTLAVRSWILPSAKLPVAVNFCVSPSGTEGIAGVTAMETSADGVTVSAVEPVMDPDVAVIVAEPVPPPAASPELSIVAIPVLEELQSTEPVRSCVLPSVYVPVAANCCLVPSATDALGGVTAILSSAAGPTVIVLWPEIPVPVALAVTCTVPVATACAIPLTPMLARVGSLDVHWTEAVMFCVLPSV
jgi:hypothetical protein